MRLELNKNIKLKLDAIKRSNYHIAGHGHAGTVAFLVNFYNEVVEMRKLINEIRQTCSSIPETVTYSIKIGLEQHFKNVIAGIVLNSQLPVNKPRKGRIKPAESSQNVDIMSE